ncbi:MAG: 4-hydroxy-tetrahydrodipicolinate reductase [Alphaproteobacteria bacterium]|nr:4-hydroxy-tetrahydrodipicolinate reductase [Alphaproteobacteria bacterium]
MNIGITGYKGRVGQLLVQNVEASETLTFIGGIEKGDDPKELFEKADAVIDFTHPDATTEHAKIAAETGTALIIGTTGLSEDQENILKDAAKKTAIVYAANMSVGVNMLLALVKQAAQRLDVQWDIEVFETHHHHKIDSPSGTALALGKAAREGRGGGDFVTDREGKRNQGDIGYAVQRGGDVVGEHMVTFFGQGERIELGHRASDRSLFAKGALRAAEWSKGKPAGLYSMEDVLDL